MKIWTLTLEYDGELGTSLHRTHDLAAAGLDTELREIIQRYELTAEADCDWEKFVLDYGLPLHWSIEEHDLSGHPAIVEAKATLHLVRARLEINDIEGEELPYIEDCNTALELLDG